MVTMNPSKIRMISHENDHQLKHAEAQIMGDRCHVSACMKNGRFRQGAGGRGIARQRWQAVSGHRKAASSGGLCDCGIRGVSDW